MPLDDTPWARGKCAYKALQYMASGIPPLVDDVGVSSRVVAGSGYVVKNDARWLEDLYTLASDPALRTRLGDEGRHQIEQGYSLEPWIATIESILRGADLC